MRRDATRETRSTSAADELRQVNAEMADLDRAQDVAGLAELMPDLVFRRADGTMRDALPTRS